MKSQHGFLRSLVRVVALTAFFAAPLSYGIFVQAEQLAADQRAIRLEMQGNSCLSGAYANLSDIIARSFADSSPSRSGSEHIASLGCHRQFPARTAGTPNLRHRVLGEGELGPLAYVAVQTINALGSDSKLVYDPHPAILNLANGVSYDLPKAQSFIAASAADQDTLNSARYEAKAEQMLLTTRYDVNEAVDDESDLAPVLVRPIQRSIALGKAFNAQIEHWQKAGRDRARSRAEVVIAERRLIRQNDVVFSLMRRTIAGLLTRLIVADHRRLRGLWVAYSFALLASVLIAWLIA